MSTTLEAELDMAAADAEDSADRALTDGLPTLAKVHKARAARLRQRAALVRELEAKANAYPLAMTYERRTIAALAGPIPAAEPCAGCLPAEGDYGDGPPPMVLGRHVEGCNGTAPTERPAPDPDTQPREPGCQCDKEIGDSPCRIHGDEGEGTP